MNISSIRIGDLGEIFDGPHATPTRREEGDLYFLNIASLEAGRLDLSQSDRVDEADFDKWTRRIRPQGDDLLFSYETRLGDAALMPKNVSGCLGRRMGLIRPDRTVVDPRFLLYSWLSPAFQEQIRTHAIHGATVSRIPLNQLADWHVPYLPIELQKGIAGVLGALDDKIAANRRTIALSDEVRSVIWNLCLRSARLIPLTSIADFVNGRAFTKDATGTGRVVVRIAELNSGFGASTIRNDIAVDDRHVVRRGDLLMSWSGSLNSARWFREEAIVNQHIFKVIPRDGSATWMVASAVEARLAYFRAVAADKATTMGHIQRRHLDEAIEWPTEIDPALNDAGTAVWDRALAAEVENEVLARTRDELLPLLMDGRITVKQAEGVVGEVV